MRDGLDGALMFAMGWLAAVLGESAYHHWWKKRCHIVSPEEGVRLCKTHRVKWTAPVESCPREGEPGGRW